MPAFILILFSPGRKVQINVRLRSVQIVNVSDLVNVQGFACSFKYHPLVIYSSMLLYPVLPPCLHFLLYLFSLSGWISSHKSQK